ncbi:MAG: acetate---CoA ligase (ADP-forming) subunit beta [Candidatus Diapherotrites archaeon]|nr:acetate---CoA ligase (ADP-forming) subunit beta [Candidatus Diapherotrites archaeon]MDN5367010.1 acetate---CoA ligase (ADP-forming) subunit beta [Candidatus Diapherotrites archaeon]
MLERFVPFAPTYVTSDVDAALRFARANYPVVLKAVSGEIVHKSDAGAVVLNVRNDDELLHHFYQLQSRFGPTVMVQKQLKGVELFVGGKRDPQFGPVVLFGLGGIFVEVYRDVVARAAPITEEDAFEMMDELRGAPILRGARGVRVDRDALARVLVQFSRFMAESENVEEVDLNPVIATADGVFAVDARVVLSGGS